MKRWPFYPLVIISATALAAAIITGVGLGSVRVPFVETARIIWAGIAGTGISAPETAIILQIRLPRVILAALVGAALSTGGVCFQAVLRNPLADPYVIGVSAGAGLGAAAGIAAGGRFAAMGAAALPACAFVGAAAATAVVYSLAVSGGRVRVGRLLLAGVAVSSFLTALMSLLLVWRQQDLQRLVFWMMGGFSGRNWDHVRVIWPYATAGLAGAFLLRNQLNLISLGEERAFHLGLAVEWIKRVALGLGALLAAAAVSVSGVIGFVGLIVPHIVRLMVGPDHRTLLPVSMLVGAAFVVAADTVARLVLAPLELPIGILTALCGTPFFLWLLVARGREGLLP